MWKFLRKRRALRSYKTTLATKLRKRYGRERHYTPEQVKTTARDAGVSNAFICFAFAMYCDREAFDAYHLAAGESCDYVAMREEIGPIVGVDGTGFDASDFVGDGGDHGGFDGGGFDGGDADAVGSCGGCGGCGGD